MSTSRRLASLALAWSATLVACDMQFAEVCADLTDCATCAATAACQWAGTECEPVEERAPGLSGAPIIDPQLCPGAEPEACSFDGLGAPCSTGKCLSDICVRPVTGNVQVRYWKPNQTQVVVPAGAGYSVSAHADAPGWNWRWDTSAPVDPATGAYRLHVPLGTATILLHGDDWVRGGVTTTATQDFVWDVAGRPEETFPPGEATVQFDASGLQAWTASADEFALATSGGYVGWLTAPYNQGHSYIQFPFALEGWPLHTPVMGDWAYVYQRANRTWGTTTIWNYISAMKVAPVSTAFTGASRLIVPVTMGNPTNATLSFDWRFSDMTAHLGLLGPGTGTSPYDFTGKVSVHPYTLTTEVMPPSELLRMRTTGGANAVVGPLTYGRLPLASANDVTTVEMTAYVAKFLPGTAPTTAYAFLRREAAVTATVTTTTALGPVRNVQYEDGSSALNTSTRNGVGTTPLLRWTAPAVGTPGVYFVRIVRLDNVGGVTEGRFVGSIATSATSLRIPPGLLQPGSTYFATIDARQGTGNLVAAPLRKLGWPRSSSRVVTGDFTP
jgi:hypothetical protein